MQQLCANFQIPVVYLLLLGLFFSHLHADTDPFVIGKRAEILFSEALHSDALTLYEQWLPSIEEEELRAHVILRMAACHLDEKQPRKALELLMKTSTGNQQNHSLYLQSRAYRQLKQSSNALNVLKQCALTPLCQQTQQLIVLEQGYHLAKQGEITAAESSFQCLSPHSNDLLPYCLAQLQLAHLYLTSHQFVEAKKVLETLTDSLAPSHPLFLEKTYLQGWVFLATHQYEQAALCFEELLPRARVSQAGWGAEVLRGLAISYLKQSLWGGGRNTANKALFQKTESLLQELYTRKPSEASHLLLRNLYLIQARCLRDPTAYELAKKMLGADSSEETKWNKRLLLAESAPSYAQRRELYKALDADFSNLSVMDSIWLLGGMNHLEEGLKCEKKPFCQDQSREALEKAVADFQKAFREADNQHPKQAALALKYQTIAHAHHPAQMRQAWESITLLLSMPSLLATLDSTTHDLYSLSAWIALRLAHPPFLKQAQAWLRESRRDANLSVEQLQRSLKLEGLICLQLGEWRTADTLFAECVERFPEVCQGEAWFWRAYVADKQNDILLKNQCLHNTYTLDPENAYAPAAYFQLYSYRDYMQGQRKAIKHLQAMPALFPDHPLLVSAYYLIGLYAKKDHLSTEGVLLRKKDWTAAIEAFQTAESTFDRLLEKELIFSDDLPYLVHVRYRAQLERALANLAIAQTSGGGKQEIYWEYAEGVFRALIQDFIDSSSRSTARLLYTQTRYPNVLAEAELQLAKMQAVKGKAQEAETSLNNALAHYEEANLKHGYGLMQIWYEKGKLALNRHEPQTALECFVAAETAIDNLQKLSPCEKFELWIHQSTCCSLLHQSDEAMRLLSRVINDEADSPLRIQAMVLRAEIYESQGRPELALKQLEAAATKGGAWGRKAQEKLEKIYGY